MMSLNPQFRTFSYLRTLIIVLMTMYASYAVAELQGEVSLFYETDQLTRTTTDSAAKTYYALDFYVDFDNKNKWFFGFHADQINHTQTINSVTGTFSSLDMGPTLGYVFDDRGTFDIQLGYLVTVKATFQETGGAAEAWNGTGIFGSFGILPEIKDDFRLGFRLNYYAGTITQSTSSGVATDVSYAKNWIFPSIVLSYRK